METRIQTKQLQEMNITWVRLGIQCFSKYKDMKWQWEKEVNFSYTFICHACRYSPSKQLEHQKYDKNFSMHNLNLIEQATTLKQLTHIVLQRQRAIRNSLKSSINDCNLCSKLLTQKFTTSFVPNVFWHVSTVQPQETLVWVTIPLMWQKKNLWNVIVPLKCNCAMGKFDFPAFTICV